MDDYMKKEIEILEKFITEKGLRYTPQADIRNLQQVLEVKRSIFLRGN